MGNQTTIEIPNGPEVNHLIGAKGASINMLQQETATHISVQKAEQAAGAAMRQVGLPYFIYFFARLLDISGDVGLRTCLVVLISCAVVGLRPLVVRICWSAADELVVRASAGDHYRGDERARALRRADQAESGRVRATSPPWGRPLHT